MTPTDFIAKWGTGGPSADLNERQGAQPYFMDLCQLLDVPTPGSADGLSQGHGDYIFEQDTLVLGAARGYADVFYRDHFAWENKAPGKNLDAALKQLLTYSLALANPPLLVVCDRLTIRIHTQFNGHPREVHTVLLPQLGDPAIRSKLRRLWTDPESFRPKKTSRAITEQAAHSFATLAELLRKRGHAPDRVSHFLTQCLFCFFAEDVGLLPGRMFERMVGNKHITSDRLTAGLATLFTTMQAGGLYGADDIPWFNGGLFQTVDVPKLEILDITELRNAAGLDWSAIDVSIFGTLFERGLDPAKRSQLGAHYTDPATIDRIVQPVVARPLLAEWAVVKGAMTTQLAKSKKYNDATHQKARQRFVQWLERLRAYRVLDPACGSGNFLFMALKTLKDIEYLSHTEAETLLKDRETDLVTGPHNLLGIEINEYAAELARVTVWIGELQWRIAHGYEFKTNPVLEPLDHIECRDALLTVVPVAGSADAAADLLPLPHAGEGGSEGVRTGAMPGPSTADPSPPPSPRRGEGATPVPPIPLVLSLSKDATATAATPLVLSLSKDHAEQPPVHAEPVEARPRYTEADWPVADAVVGNPPFLGVSRKRSELGEPYTRALDAVFAGRVPGGADLVCYWFDKALAALANTRLATAGLVATNSIRGGASRKVLEAIVRDSAIVEAWSDEAWINDGAAVRVSLICFGAGASCTLNGAPVPQIYADLTAPTVAGDSLNLGLARPLPANANASFQGASKKAKFEIPAQLPRDWLRMPNPHGRPNSDVLKPWANGFELSRGPQHQWIVDFGNDMRESAASLYEQPFAMAFARVKPERVAKGDSALRTFWWRFGRPRVEMRIALAPLPRFVATVAHSKHRFFVWLPVTTSPDQALITVARADDATLGLLHSRFHELWSLRMGTSIGVGNDPRYTPTTCFETFPFPNGLTPADTAHQRTETLEESGAQIPADLTGPLRAAAARIATAAHRLDTLRQAWLNPPEWTHRVPEVIPLGMDASPYPDRIEPKPGLGEVALKQLRDRTLTKLYNQRPQWLAAAHIDLDAAVAAAYALGDIDGAAFWNSYTADTPDDAILARLLALNLQRAAAGAPTTAATTTTPRKTGRAAPAQATALAAAPAAVRKTRVAAP